MMASIEKKTCPPGERAAHFRHEYKYRIDKGQEEILKVRVASILPLDPHADSNGIYTVRSLYFDDIKNTCFCENMMGSDPRSKFRIRYYNADTENILLEKKNKIRGMCLKHSCSITAEECEMLVQGHCPTITEDMPEIKRKLLTEVMVRGLSPKVIVTYERAPFIHHAGNVRVTFDRNITASDDLDRFLSGTYSGQPAIIDGTGILEVKWDELLPRHIKDTLWLDNLSWSAMSKFCVCRRWYL